MHFSEETPERWGMTSEIVNYKMKDAKYFYKKIPPGSCNNRPLFFCYANGSQGAGEGEFNYSEDITVDAKGSIYILDNGNHRSTSEKLLS